MSAHDFSVSVQGSSAYPVSPVSDQRHLDLDSLPLPDHFPEPYCDPYMDCDIPCSGDAAPQPYGNHVAPPRLETGDAARYGDCSSSSLRAKVDAAAARQSRGESQEAKEGVRRITDKYAAPGALVRTSSASASPGVFSPSAAHDMPAHAAARPPAAAASMNSLHSSVESGNGGRLRVGTGSVSAFSDASSDLSDASPVPPWTAGCSSLSTTSGSTSGGLEGAGLLTHGAGGGSGSRLLSVGGVSLANLGDGVTEHDVQQVEMFYRSHKSEVTVCRCLANLYFGSSVRQSTAAADGGAPSSGSDSWEFVSTGIPLLLLDSGQHVRERKLSVVLAEKGTGFVLWKDVITHLTHYSCPHGNFHTLRVSSDNNKLAGLSFDDAKAASDFAATIRHLTSDPDDDLLKLSKKGKKKKRQDTRRGKYKAPKKTDISQPCCFQHVTKLERPQLQVGELLPPPPNGFPPAPSGSLSSLSDSFQDRVTLGLPRARSQSSELSEVSSATSEH